MIFISRIFLSFLLSGALLFGGARGGPKNIIILIGDGMGVSHVGTTFFTEPDSPFRHFPVIGLSVTCSADKLITDSAAGGTALATGKRTKNKYISVDTLGAPVTTILEYAEKKGKATGVVVTSTMTNATPAAFLAHHKDRSKEREIAAQYPETEWEVLIGGGLKHFVPDSGSANLKYGGDVRAELIRKGYAFFTAYDSLKEAAPQEKFYAILSKDGLPQAAQRKYTLSDLMAQAMRVLKQRKQGFVLMVEGSQIDWACEEDKVRYLLGEMKDFSDAVASALEFARKDGNTLVLVTGDHETGGLAITDGKRDGSNLKLAFAKNGHTAGPVGVFAYGPGSEHFGGIQENYQIGEKIINLIIK